jgi:glycosyltransferase involved in cell wall biosynthesis
VSSHDQTMPLVTAVVICYNHERFVVESLESVKAQDYSNLHLVVIDDCSKDGSVEVIRRWLDQFWPDAVFIAHKKNVGVCRTLNEALAHAKGKYIRLLAGDDRWAPHMLSRQVEFMEHLPEDVGVLYSDAYRMDESGELLPKMFIEFHRLFPKAPEEWIFDTLFEGNFIPAPTALIRLRCFEAVGTYDENLIFEDWDMWLRIARQFRFMYFPVPTAYYRIVSTSMTNTLSAEMKDADHRIVVKCLRRGWLAGRAKDEAIWLEYLEACLAYRRRLPSRVGEAAWAFRHRPCIKHALLLSAVVGLLPYERFKRLIKLLTNMKHRAKRLVTNRAD